MRIEGIFRVSIFGSLLFGELIAYLVVLLANGAVFFHFLENLPIPQTTALIPVRIAKTLGHIACLNFSILVVLPQRNSIWVPIFGISIERVIKYHRIMGRILFVAITTHLGAFWYIWISRSHILSAPPGITYALMRASLVGHAVWICILVILITSMECVRRAKFELFFYTHHLFLAVVGLALYHTYLTQSWDKDMLLYWLVPGIVMYIGDLLIRSWRSRIPTRLISVVKDEGANIILVKLQRNKFRFQPGQYAYINFPQVSYLEWHPFSIASAPSESPTRDTLITLAIRDMGRTTWSGKLHKLFDDSLLPEKIKVRLDGPYGTLSIDLDNYPILVLIAGGIGISPLISILNEYNNNPSLAFEKLYFMWCAKQQDFLVPFSFILQNIETNDMLGKLEIHRYATRDLESARRPYNINDMSQRGLSLNGRLTNTIPQQFTPGRPVMRDFFSRLVSRHPTSRIGVIVCGPTVMADDVAKTCQYFNKRHRPQIDLHRESFEI